MNWDLIGHEWAVDLLREHVAQGRLRHAYLFSGPPGVGRCTLALRFAQAINCLYPPQAGERCGTCRNCTLIERMQHPDLSVLQAETIGGTLKVDVIRELIQRLALTPFEARYRLALLLRFEEANLSAANALLKTLEEPSPKVILILTAEDQEYLPDTIVSRCEVLRLRPVPVDRVEKGLIDTGGLPQDQAHLLASISLGRPGYAYNLANDPGLLVERAEWLQDMQELLVSNRVKRFAYADKISKDKDKEKLAEALHVWLSLWRDILLEVAGCKPKYSNPDRQEVIIRIAGRMNVEQSRQFIAALLRTQDLLTSNINRQLAVEVLLLSLPRI
jgi:DNA polymerase III subunit delta'